MQILAHRGYLDGPSPLLENRREALASCIELGFGVETDIRRAADGRFYISHDVAPISSDNDATGYAASLRAARAPIALNIKEFGYEQALLGFLNEQQLIDRVFLFDMELIERDPGATARAFRELHETVAIAARVSDRNESIERALAIREANVIWLDEFDRLWARETDVHRLNAAGKRVYAVSPELHGFSLEVAKLRWAELADWGVAGICTDFPQACQAWYRSRQ